jgi:hypothetical protein
MDYAIYAPVFACLIYIFFLYNNRKDWVINKTEYQIINRTIFRLFPWIWFVFYLRKDYSYYFFLKLL